MTTATPDMAITVILPRASVALLVDALRPLLGEFHPSENNPAHVNSPMSERVAMGVGQQPQKYSFKVLGEALAADNLPEVFAKVIDLIDDLDPDVLDKFSKNRSSSVRSYIARDKQNVHSGRPDLPTLKTKSGWWISKNISRWQLVSYLKALCSAAGLVYGEDISFRA